MDAYLQVSATPLVPLTVCQLTVVRFFHQHIITYLLPLKLKKHWKLTCAIWFILKHKQLIELFELHRTLQWTEQLLRHSTRQSCGAFGADSGHSSRPEFIKITKSNGNIQ